MNSGIYVLAPEFFALLPDEGDHETTTFPSLPPKGASSPSRATPTGAPSTTSRTSPTPSASSRGRGEHRAAPVRRPPRLSDEAGAISGLINSAYRGESSRRGWTTETDLVGGGRMDAATLAALIADDSNALLVIDGADGPIASVFLERHDGYAHLGMLSVRPSLQATGLGRRLLAEAEHWVAREWTLSRIQMTVIRQRPELIAWYERRGYQQTGELHPFDINDERFGIPKVAGLEFAVLEKVLP